MILLLLLLLAAMYFDIRFFRIPNKLILVGIGTGMCYRFLFPEELFFYQYLVAMTGIFLILVPIYKLGAIGGGDVKLLSVCALFMGVYDGLEMMVLSFLFGAFFSIIFLVYHRFFSKQIQTKRHVIHFSIPIFFGILTEWLWGGFLWQI